MADRKQYKHRPFSVRLKRWLIFPVGIFLISSFLNKFFKNCTRSRSQNFQIFLNHCSVSVYRVLQVPGVAHEDALVVLQVPGNKVTPRHNAL